MKKLIMLLLVIMLASCSADDPQPVDPLTGTWLEQDEYPGVGLLFRGDDYYRFQPYGDDWKVYAHGKYTVSGDTLTTIWDGGTMVHERFTIIGTALGFTGWRILFERSSIITEDIIFQDN